MCEKRETSEPDCHVEQLCVFGAHDFYLQSLLHYFKLNVTVWLGRNLLNCVYN